MKQFLSNHLTRRLVACLLILSMLITYTEVPVRAALKDKADAGLSLFATEDPVPLSTIAAGTTILFAGEPWILLDPTTGLMIRKNSYGAARHFDDESENLYHYFQPWVTTNVAYILNNDFYDSLPASDRNWIRSENWFYGPGPDSVTMDYISCKVGLLDITQVAYYKALMQGQLSDGTWWTANYHGNYSFEYKGSPDIYYVNQDGDLAIEYNDANPHDMRPAIYLRLDTPVLNNEVPSPQNHILAFSVAGQVGSSTINQGTQTVSFSVSDQVDLTSITPTITLSAGATIEPSVATAQNFTTPVTYTVTSIDGIAKNWTVGCTVLDSETDISGFSVPEMSMLPSNPAVIDPVNHTITFKVPIGTNVTELVPSFLLSDGAASVPATGVKQNFTSPVTYIVTAEAGNTQNWTVTCSLYNDQKEYHVEHYRQNPSGSDYTLFQTTKHTSKENTVVTAQPQTYQGFTEYTGYAGRVASGTVSAQETLVLKLYYNRDTFTRQFEENGGTTVQDISGIRYDTVLNAPVEPVKEYHVFEGWYQDEYLTIPYNFASPVMADHTLYAKWRYDYSKVSYFLYDSSVLHINYKNGTVFTPPEVAAVPGYSLKDWYLEPTFATLYQFQQPIAIDMCLYAQYLRSGKDILEFNVPGQVGGTTISANEHKITFHMPYGTDTKALTPSVTASAGAATIPTSLASTDFTSPVSYTVTSEFGEQQQWTATCVIDKNTANTITGLTVPGQVGSSLIDPASNTVRFSVPYGTDRSSLAPVITVSANASVLPLSGSTMDFSGGEPVTCQVVSENGVVREWKLYCSVLPNTQKNITAFEVTGQMGNSQIDAVSHTVEFQMPYTAEVTALRPVIALNNNAVCMPASLQAVDFTQPVQYTVTAEDGSKQVWTIRCIRKNTANDITAFTIPNQYGNTSIDTTNHSIHFYLNQGTSAKALVPTISVSAGAEIYPASGSVTDFSDAVTYLVTAQDGSPQAWTVTYGYHNVTKDIIVPTEAPKQEEQPEEEQKKLEDVIVETAKEQVEVSTGAATVTGPNSAILSGTLVKGGGDQLQTGFRYRETTSQQWVYTSVQSANLTNGQSFSAEINGLKPSTLYEFEVRASNSNGLSNGGSSSFTTQKAELPKVVTNNAAFGTLGSMLLSGDVVADGGDKLQDAGFLWGTSETDLKKLSLGARKNLSSELKQLDIGKTYYYQAYATNSTGTGAGQLLTITIPGLAVTTLEATDITEKSATLKGKVTGKDKYVDCGFTISPGKLGVVTAKADEKGNFEIPVDELLPGKTYYYTAFVKTEKKTYYGKSKKLILINSIPEVDTNEVSELGQIWANLSGVIHDNEETETSEDAIGSEDKEIPKSIEAAGKSYNNDEEASILESGFYWGEDTDTLNQIILIHEGIKSISNPVYRLVGLQAGTTYYYKAYAKNEKGTGYGDILSFTTAEPTKPVVNTRSVGYDIKRAQWLMSGNIANKGGVALAEYGFLVSSDGVDWSTLAIGFDTNGNYVARDLPAIRQLQPGTYYIKAYALNSVGAGEGGALPLTIPTLPTVVAEASPASPTPGTYILKGSITGTGAEGALCSRTCIKYRKKGDKDWLIASEATGEFGVSTFSIELKGFLPEETYEYMAEATNSTGISSSLVVEFTADYGKETKQAMDYFRSIDTKPQNIINILKNYYGCGMEAAAQLLLQYGYTGEEIGLGLKVSEFRPTYQEEAGIFAKLGYSAETTVKLLTDNYEAIRQKEDRQFTGLIAVLKECGYPLKESFSAIANRSQYDAVKLLTLFVNSNHYTRDEVLDKAHQVYGQTAVVNYLWSTYNRRISVYHDNLVKTLGAFITDLRTICRMDSVSIADELKKCYSALDTKTAAQTFADEGYPIEETVSLLNYLYGASETDLADALNLTSYGKEDIVRYLIQKAGLNAVQIVYVITNCITGWGDPVANCIQVLKKDYNLDVVGTANAMYAAGWKEKPEGKGVYGLNHLLRAMADYYGIITRKDQIKLLKDIGRSMNEIAKIVNGPIDVSYMIECRANGFTVSDVAVYCINIYRDNNAAIGSTISFSDGAGYELSDIAVTLRTVFKLDADSALAYLKKGTLRSGKQLNDAIKAAYQDDPLMKIVKAMSGNSAKDIASALRYTYSITSPQDAVMYLQKAGYSSDSILQGVWAIYFNQIKMKNFEEYLAFAKSALPNCSYADALNAVVVQLGGKPVATDIMPTALRLGYELKDTLRIMKEEYKLTLNETVNAIRDRYGVGKETEYFPVVLSVYSLDQSSFIEYERMRGTDVNKCAELLLKKLSITKPEEVAALLAKAGFNQTEVTEVLLDKFFSNSLLQDNIAQIDSIIKQCYPEKEDEQLKKLLKDGQLQPISKAIGVLLQEDYSLEAIIKALKKTYNLSDARIIDELNAIDRFGSDEISIAALGVLGSNYLTEQIRQWKAMSNNKPEDIWRNLKNEAGITTSEIIFRYMRLAGYSETDTADAAYLYLREGMIPVIRNVYGAKDALELATVLSRIKSEQISQIDLYRFAEQLKLCFPGISAYEIARALLAFGYEVNSGNDRITDWLRFQANDGTHDNQLAASLGTNNAGLQIPVRYAVEIMKGKGYNLQDAVYWLLQCGFTWEEFYPELCYTYSVPEYSTEYDLHSNTTYIVRSLKDYYDIKDIALGEYSYTKGSSLAMIDLIVGGYTIEQSLYASLWHSKSAASDMVMTLVDSSIWRANAARDQSLRLNAVQAATKVFDASLAVAYDKQQAGITDYNPISMTDIANSLIQHGPSNRFASFSNWEVLAAMQAVADRYNQLYNTGIPSRELALAILKQSGVSASDAAAMLAAHKVGLSTSSIVKSVIGIGNDWMDAVQAMMGAGYSATDSASAVFSNPTYRNIIGIGVLSSLVAVAAKGTSSDVLNYIQKAKQLAKLGFRIAEGKVTLEDLYRYEGAYMTYKYGKMIYNYIPADYKP